MFDLAANEDLLHYQGSESIYCEDEDGNVYEQYGDFVFEGRKIVWSNPPEIREAIYD